MEKEKKKTRKAIEEIKHVLASIQATPQTARYIWKMVKQEGKYQIPKGGRKLPEYLNDAEIDLVLSKALTRDPTTSLLIHIGIFTGLRIAEMRNLQVPHIDFENRQLKVVEGKGGKDRYVPLSMNLMQHLKAYLNGRTRGYVLVKKTEKPYSIRALQDKVMRVYELCRLAKNLSTHSLRHTYATLLRRSGMSIQDIQVLMGHSSVKTTEIYSHMELGPIKEQYVKMIGVS